MDCATLSFITVLSYVRAQSWTVGPLWWPRVRFNMESLFPGRRDDHNWLPTEIVAQPSLMQGRVRNLGGQKAPA